MCNLSEGIRQKYIAKGRAEGYAEERLQSIQSIMRTAKVTAE